LVQEERLAVPSFRVAPGFVTATVPYRRWASSESRHAVITLVRADMRRFALQQRFPLVIMTCNSLAHQGLIEDGSVSPE
jgi:hypothetical protein